MKQEFILFSPWLPKRPVNMLQFYKSLNREGLSGSRLESRGLEKMGLDRFRV